MTEASSATWPAYLVPDGSIAPLDEDDDLAKDLQAAIVGMTGLDTNLVRPRWQATPPQEPEYNIDWCAVGVTDESGGSNPVMQHFGDRAGGLGADEMQTQEEIMVVATFYGAHANALAKLLRDGLKVAQNRDMMNAVGLNFVESKGPMRTADQVGTRWRNRADLTITFVRMFVRSYPVRNLVSLDGAITMESRNSDAITVP